MQRILIIGAGYAGQRLAAAHAMRGDAVTATSRSVEGKTDSGWKWLPLDLDADCLPALPQADRIYYTVPPARTGTSDERIRRILPKITGAPQLVYFSTTGVYGDADGAWVNEESPLAPGNDRSRRRLDAEEAVAEWAKERSARHVILRVAGIYGPGRLPVSRLQQGHPVLDPQQAGYSNRIHVDDLVRAAIAAADYGEDMICNVADGKPSSTAEILDITATMTGLPKPRRIAWEEARQEFSDMALSFMRDNKRVDITRLANLPNFAFVYPDFEAGLRASLEEEQKSG